MLPLRIPPPKRSKSRKRDARAQSLRVREKGSERSTSTHEGPKKLYADIDLRTRGDSLYAWLHKLDSLDLRRNASTPARHIAELLAELVERLEAAEPKAGRSLLVETLEVLLRRIG